MVNNLVGHAATTGKLLLQSDGTPWRPLVHIRDIHSAFLACLSAPVEVLRGQAFNIGRSDENYRIREVARIVAEVVPDCEVTFAPGASADLRNYRVDVTRAETRLPGYAPSWTVRRGIEELYRGYLEGRLGLDEWSGPRFFRLRTIQRLRAAGALDDELRPRSQ